MTLLDAFAMLVLLVAVRLRQTAFLNYIMPF
jgi:hypothetical protein